MDVKKKEMDLLSNTIAAYAHIKGKLYLIWLNSINFNAAVFNIASFVCLCPSPQLIQRALGSTLCSEYVSAWC